MIQALKEHSAKFWWQLAGSVVAAIAVGFGSAWWGMSIKTEKMDTRLTFIESKIIGSKLLERTNYLEEQIKRHEKALDQDFARHVVSMTEPSPTTDDQDNRLTRLETLVNETQVLLTEIRADVKILLRGGQQ